MNEDTANTVSIGAYEGNVHIMLTSACGNHEKILSARGAREMGHALIRLADRVNDLMPSLDAPVVVRTKPPVFLILACAAVVFCALRKV